MISDDVRVEDMMVTKREKDLLTVVLVTYNQREIIYETIDTVLMQDYPHIELIITDDGTPNFPSSEIKEYIDFHKSDNLRYVTILANQTNVGTVRNVNRALEVSRGEYIKLISGDDTFTNEKVFSAQVGYLLENPHMYAVVSCSQQCNEKMQPIWDARVEKSNNAIHKVLQMNYNDARKYIFKEDIFPIAMQATCFRATFFAEKGLNDERFVLLDDSPTVLRMLQCYPNVGYLDLVAVNHRAFVGVSSSKERFLPRQKKYYQDCMKYAELEYLPNPNIYGYWKGRQRFKFSKAAYELILLKEEKVTLHKLLRFVLGNFDIILVYFFKHPIKAIVEVFSQLGVII